MQKKIQKYNSTIIKIESIKLISKRERRTKKGKTTNKRVRRQTGKPRRLKA